MSVKSYAEWSVQTGFAVIRLNNPPVNALSPALIEELLQAIAQSENDKNVVASILIGAS